MSSGGWVCAVVVAPSLSLSLGLAAGWGRGAATVLGGCLAVVLGLGLAAGACFSGLCCSLAWPVAGCEAAGALAVGGAPAVGTGFGSPFR